MHVMFTFVKVLTNKITLQMRKILFAIGLFAALFSYSSVTSTFTTFLGEPAYQFEVIDPAYMPAFYYDAMLDAYPPSGWSYFWQTDEGAISHEEKPYFYFTNVGSHEVTVILVPRKKEDDIGTVSLTHTLNIADGQTSSTNNGDIMNDGIYFLTPPRLGNTVLVVVPLNSCDIITVPHQNSVAFDNTKLSFLGLLNVNNYSAGSVVAHTDIAMGEPTNSKVDFIVNWYSLRTDMAAVLSFSVLANQGEAVAIKHIPDTALRKQCKEETEAIEYGIVGPYDPNYKESSILEINVSVTDSSKLDSTSVEYTIHFQNIGTGPVDSITVIDSLPSYLVFENHVSSSLPAAKVNVSTSGNIVTWILAPDADIRGTNESPSQAEYETKGWVKFKAKIAPEGSITYDTCYCLCNRATIYFDSLTPITTKADVIAIGDRLCFSFVEGNDKNDTYAEQMCYDSTSFYGNTTAGVGSLWKVSAYSPLSVYPNPTAGVVQFKGDFKGELSISVANMYGQVVLERSTSQYTMDLSELPKGAYTVRVSDEDTNYVARVVRY
jgi:uncharacterized repeat protein (TIGR01451 family)